MSRKREKAYNPTSRHPLYSYPKRRRPIPPPTTAAGAGDTQSQKPSPPPALLIIGLPGDCSVLDLKSRFEIYGPISRIRIDHSGVGFITYRTKSAADDAFAAALDPSFGITIDSKRVQVLWTTDERGREGGGIEADKMNSSKLVRGEVPLSRHGRGGKVLTWGRGSSGQLGHGDLTNCLQPQLIRSLDTLFISHVSAGWNHSGFVSDTGRLFTCGDGSFGQLGHGDYQSYASPVEVSFFGSKHVDQIACGMRHSLVLERGGQVYGFGSGKRGQLGVSKYKIKSSSLPQLSLGLEDVKIGRIYANGDHSAALSADGQLYSWGRGFSGAADASIPHCSCTSTSFTQAALGWNHALALTSEGELFMLGGRHHGSLGDPEKISQVQDISELSRQPNLCKVPGLSGMNVSHIAAGAEHSALVTDRGEILTWGWGEHGQLGLGNTNDQTHPQLVRLGHAYTNPISSDVYCGSGFTIALSTLPTFGG